MNKLLTIGAVGLILLSAPALVRAADVLDEGHFFSAEAIDKANHSIRDIEKRSGHEIRIETHATVPADKRDAVAKMDKKEREKFTHDWTIERAETTNAKGFFLLVVKDPSRMETWVSQRLKKAGFTTTDRDRAKDAMLAGLKDKDYDTALHDVLSKLSTAYARVAVPHMTAEAPMNDNRPGANHPVVPAANHPVAPVPNHPVAQVRNGGGWMSVLFILGAVVLGIFVISMISRMFSGGGRGYGPGYGGGPPMGQPGYGGGGYGGGGGGFMSTLAGGIFGSMAGNWLYDSMTGRSAHAHETLPGAGPVGGGQALGDDRSPQGDGGWSNDNDSNSGGWFGGDSSGGGGGGDFGGGDSGGGGDYGGGGDF